MDADEALTIWRGLVNGRWSVVDHRDADGLRILLVRENSPIVNDPKSLTRAAAAVVAFLAMVHPAKYVA